MLPAFGNLLHVVAFTVSRFVTVDMIDADAVGRSRKRTRKRLEGAWADGSHDGGRLSVNPSKGGGRVSHGDFIATMVNADDLFLGVNPEGLAKLPADEQQACRKLWADIDALLARASRP